MLNEAYCRGPSNRLFLIINCGVIETCRIEGNGHDGVLPRKLNLVERTVWHYRQTLLDVPKGLLIVSRAAVLECQNTGGIENPYQVANSLSEIERLPVVINRFGIFISVMVSA